MQNPVNTCFFFFFTTVNVLREGPWPIVVLGPGDGDILYVDWNFLVHVYP